MELSQRLAFKRKILNFLFLIFICVTSHATLLKLSLPEKNMKRDSVLFLLGAFSLPNTWLVNEGTLEVNEEDLPSSISEALRVQPANPLGKLLLLQKTGSYNHYRHFRHSFPVPENVQALERDVKFSQWIKEVIPFSQAKGKKRVIFRSQELKMAVAQTHECRNVRETELIVKRDNSEDYDFFAYDSEGRLSVSSLFYNSKTGKNVAGLVPYTCMTCHYDRGQHVFQPLPLSFHP